MTKPGNIRDELRKLTRGIHTMQAREEAEPAYVLQDADTLLLPLAYPTNLETALRDVRRSRFGKGMRIFRLEPVSDRGRA